MGLLSYECPFYELTIKTQSLLSLLALAPLWLTITVFANFEGWCFRH